nr:uncharacterized protein LOC109157220 [Ipomoea batatas]
MEGVFPLISQDQWRIFNTRITKDEVHSVLFDMAPFKFPGPDGFHVAFYQQMWGIVGDNMSNLVRNIVDTGCLPDGLNDLSLSLFQRKLCILCARRDVPRVFAKVIMGGIRSPSFSVLWNDERLPQFRPGQGIRQGDAMSPAIFILYMEKLS